MVSKHYCEGGLTVLSVITFRSGCCEMEIIFIFLIIVLKLPVGQGGTGGTILVLTGSLGV